MSSVNRNRAKRSRARKCARRFVWLAALLLLLCRVQFSKFLLEQPYVCIFGNAQKRASAERVYRMWNKRFPVVYFHFGTKDETDADFKLSSDVHTLTAVAPSTFAYGANASLNAAKQIHRSCQYFFLHDDDIYFELSKLASRGTISEELLYILRRYKPLFLSFEWSAGSHFPASKAAKIKYGTSEVSPTVASDSGMTVYHRSVLDLFFPLHPDQEGGFNGGWTLPTHFLDAITPCIRGLRSNTLKYKNINNPDSLGTKLSWEIRNGTAVAVGVSHPYEFPQNENYTTFLYSASRELLSCRARDCFKDFVPKQRLVVDNIDSWLVSLHESFDVRHPAFSNNKLLRSPAVSDRLLQLIKTTPFKLRFTLLSFKRLGNTRELAMKLLEQFLNWRELVKSEDVSVETHVHVDYSDEFHEHFTQLQEDLGGLYSNAGQNLSFTLTERHGGLRDSWLRNWQPVSQDEFNVIIEDDIDISPALLREVIRLIRGLYYTEFYPHRLIFAINLHAEITNDIVPSLNPDIIEGLKRSPSLRATPSSWGAIFGARTWNSFQRWYDAHEGEDPLMPDALSNRWPKRSSWKKFALRFLAENMLYTYQPLFPEGKSLTKKQETHAGTNDQNVQGEFMLNFLTKEDPAIPIIPFHQVHRYDHLLRTPDLNAFDTFDGCTLMMPVCKRLEFLESAIYHYSNLADARLRVQIIVVVQSCDFDANIIRNIRDRWERKVHLTFKYMLTNDMNNRFLLFDDMRYDCTINVDDDVLHPIPALRRNIDFWRQHFFESYVGWSEQARSHSSVGDQITYVMDLVQRKWLPSMLLPSGSIIHRKYLKLYNSEQFIYGRNIVSMLHNCDDILMNFVIASKGNCPVIIQESGTLQRDVLRLLASSNISTAQWKSPFYFQKRQYCLMEFTKLYGNLNYSATRYRFNPEYSGYWPKKTLSAGTMVYEYSQLIPSRDTKVCVEDCCGADA